MPLIALVDANNFFVSCERSFKPELEGKPLAILSANDGCIIARSNEVKALGIPMGIPLFKVKDLVKQHNITVLSANFNLYVDLSTRLMKILQTFAKNMEVYSIDEAFLTLYPADDPFAIASLIKTTVKQSLGIPVSIGIACSKVLSKAANYFAKKYTSQICVFQEKQDISMHLNKLPIEEIWGIGRRQSEKLLALGLETALDLTHADPKWIRKILTVQGEKLVQELSGISCMPIEETRAAKQSTQVCRSFGRMLTTYQELRSPLITYLSSLGVRLRKQHLQAKSLLVFIQTNYHKEKFTNSTIINLPYPANDSISLVKYGLIALKKIFVSGYSYKKLGVIALELTSGSPQLEMFNQEDFILREKYDKVFCALDKINHKFGGGSAGLASSTADLSWRPRSSNRSSDYTISWTELLTAYAK